MPDQSRCIDLEEPPRPVMGEPGDRFVESPGPPDDRSQLLLAQNLGVDVDNATRKVGEHLATVLVEAEDPRDMI